MVAAAALGRPGPRRSYIVNHSQRLSDY
jgi:hypothetical protein